MFFKPRRGPRFLGRKAISRPRMPRSETTCPAAGLSGGGHPGQWFLVGDRLRGDISVATRSSISAHESGIDPARYPKSSVTRMPFFRAPVLPLWSSAKPNFWSGRQHKKRRAPDVEARRFQTRYRLEIAVGIFVEVGVAIARFAGFDVEIARACIADALTLRGEALIAVTLGEIVARLVVAGSDETRSAFAARSVARLARTRLA